MLLAVISDIHGNLPALEAALEAIDEAGIHSVVNAGDSVGGYPFPNEVIACLERRSIPNVQGECDRATASLVRKHAKLPKRFSQESIALLQWTYDRLSSANIEYLLALPRMQRILIDGIDVCFSHGSPTASGETIGADTGLERFRRYREAARADIVIGGKTHQPFHQQVDDTLFVNTGTTGCDPRGAAYAIISTEQEPWTVAFHYAPYDRATVEQATREAGIVVEGDIVFA